MPYLAPTLFEDRRALMANTDAREQMTETSRLSDMLSRQKEQRANELRTIYSTGGQPNLQQIGAVDPNAALEYQNNQSLQAQRDLDNQIKRQNAIKGLSTQMITTAERYGFKRDDPSTYGALEQLAPKFKPLYEGITGTKAQDGPLDIQSIIAMADMTPGELAQQKTQQDIEAFKQKIPYQVDLDRQTSEARVNAEVGKQQRIQPMEIELERYKSGLRTQQQIEETAGKAAAQAQINLPKAIDQAKQAYSILEQLKTHPGLSSSVGVPGIAGGLLGGIIVPGTNAANFNSKLKQIQGQAFLQAFEALKGGGQITEIEGQKATEAMANLDKAQSEEQFIDSLSELQGLLKAGIERSAKIARGDYSNEDSYTGSWGEKQAPQTPQIPKGAITRHSPSTNRTEYSIDGGETWTRVK